MSTRHRPGDAWIAWVGIALICLAVTGACAPPRKSRRVPSVTPRPGTVREGIASWYGPGFHGKLTANGERYDQNGITAAHYNWAFGTRVKVTLLSTGKSTVVRINDRFPRRDRVIDLSKGSARKIGLLGPGVGKVRLEVLD